MSLNPITICTKNLILSRSNFTQNNAVVVGATSPVITLRISNLFNSTTLDMINLKSASIGKSALDAFIAKVFKYLFKISVTTLDRLIVASTQTRTIILGFIRGSKLFRTNRSFANFIKHTRSIHTHQYFANG